LALQERALEAAPEIRVERRDKLRRKLDKINADESLALLAVTDTSTTAI
jgi:hypothetical protein